MNYQTFLKNKNLSLTSIEIYLKNIRYLAKYIDLDEINLSNIIKFINEYSSNHSANSTRLMYHSIVSFLKYKKKWKLISEFCQIKLPKSKKINRTTISIEEFNHIKTSIKLSNYNEYRNWLIFVFLFSTGIRVSELMKIKINNQNLSSLEVIGKGNKTRTIYICEYLQNLLKNWKYSQITIKKNQQAICYKTINSIIAKIGLKYFNKSITCHTLRRSYATNLIRKNIDIKTVSELLGHENINTTASYIFMNSDEIKEKVLSIFSM